ncbi:MAG: hypothetical protein IT280_07175 [Ignavibacteria bacterium]|nr:hypothetical protein [Ignavibacteria bacterium]
MILSFIEGITLLKKESLVLSDKTEIKSAEINQQNNFLSEHNSVSEIENVTTDKTKNEDYDKIVKISKGNKPTDNPERSDITFEMKYNMLLKQLEKERQERELITGK